MNNFMYDPNSRYNNLDNDNIIFLTPKQLIELDIGIDPESFEQNEYDELVPVLVDSIKEMIKETTLGDVNGSDIALPVENSNCKIFLCIEINGKLHRLQTEEYDTCHFNQGLSVSNQIKLFQRLISMNKVTLNDLAAEDIDNNVYKKLVINDLEGVNLFKKKIDIIDSIVKEQQDNLELAEKRDKVRKMSKELGQ